MRADNTKKRDWTAEQRAAQSEKMSRACAEAKRIRMKKNPDKPWGGRVQKLSDDDLRLIHELALERELLRTEHQLLLARAADLWDQIQALSNTRIAEKFDVSKAAISHALHSTRGNRVA